MLSSKSHTRRKTDDNQPSFRGDRKSTVLYCTMSATSSSAYDSGHAMYLRESTGMVTCLSFGPNRSISYPLGFFCQECKAYEMDKHSNPFRRMKRSAKIYTFNSNHTDVDNPSQVVVDQTFCYASSLVGISQIPTSSEVARGHRALSPHTTDVSLPVAKKKKGISVTCDPLNHKVMQLQAQLNDERDAHNTTR